MAVTTLAKPAVAAFPAAEVEAALRTELLQTIETEAAIQGIALPTDAAGQAAASIQIDSLVVVDIILAVEPLVDFELPDSVVRAGGYRSVNEAIGHLMPGIAKEWQKRKGGKK